MSCAKCGCEGSIGCSRSDCPSAEVWKEATKPVKKTAPKEKAKPVPSHW